MCSKCTKAGHFVHSSAFIKERFVEKQIRLENIRKALKALDEQAEIFFGRQRHEENLKVDIKRRRRAIEWLTQLVTDKRQAIETDRERLDVISKSNVSKRLVLPRYEDKVKILEDYLLSKIDELEQTRVRHRDTLAELKEVTRINIGNLVRYIYPIRQVVDGQDTEGVIEEASRTVCVRGKWHTHHTDKAYLIVAPYLPSDGDYNIYNDWVLTNRGESLPSSVTHENLISNSAHRICAALTYTTQLLQTSAFYLDVRLPYKLNFSDFCRIDLPEHKFNRRVARLNANILQLAYTQHVDLKTLNPSATLENLHQLLIESGAADLGRRGPVNRDNCLTEDADKQLVVALNSGTDSDEESGSDESHDWEAIQPAALELTPQVAMPQQSNWSLTSMFRWK